MTFSYLSSSLRNQAMRKKLILYFKRRNHARKQWVSIDTWFPLGLGHCRVTVATLGWLPLNVRSHLRAATRFWTCPAVLLAKLLLGSGPAVVEIEQERSRCRAGIHRVSSDTRAITCNGTYIAPPSAFWCRSPPVVVSVLGLKACFTFILSIYLLHKSSR